LRQEAASHLGEQMIFIFTEIVKEWLGENVCRVLFFLLIAESLLYPFEFGSLLLIFIIDVLITQNKDEEEILKAAKEAALKTSKSIAKDNYHEG
jgi:hypothetical protein